MKTTVSELKRNHIGLTERKKKSEKADLEKKKAIFFQIGLIISLCIVFLACEWRSYDNNNSVLLSSNNICVLEELPPITNLEKPEPKIAQSITPVFIEVPNETHIEKEAYINAEVNPDEMMEEYRKIQIKKEEEIEEIIEFLPIEDQPTFKGGESALFEYLKNNIHYPSNAREIGIQGIVYIYFVVEKDGSISNVSIARGIGGGCDEEAARVIKNMPLWNPGSQRGKAVRVKFNVPIKFTLSN